VQFTVEVPIMLSVKEASKIYEKGPGTKTIYDAIASGELKCYRPNGRDFLIKAVDFTAWIETKRFKPQYSKEEMRQMKNGIA